MSPFEGIEIDLWKIFPPFAAVLLMRETSFILLPGMIWRKAGWLKW